MSSQKLTILFAALFLFMVAWSAGLGIFLMDWLEPETEMGHYLINKGVLTVVFALVLWRLKLFAAVGFGPGMGMASYVIGLPLFALGVLAFFEPGRAAVSLVDFAGWTVVVLFIAFTEESLFRGVLWKAFAGKSLCQRAAITSVMFGLIHMIAGSLGGIEWTIAGSQAIFAASFGLILAAMRERAGTIWSVIIAHVVFDVAAVSAAGGVSAILEPGLETSLRFLAPAFVFSAWGSSAIYLIGRRKRRKSE